MYASHHLCVLGQLNVHRVGLLEANIDVAVGAEIERSCLQYIERLVRNQTFIGAEDLLAFEGA